MKKRILALLLALVMLVGVMPTALATEEAESEASAVTMLDVSKSKTATALDANGQTQITLSLPSAEMKKTLDVVFVVDNAFPQDNDTAAQQAANLMTELEKISTDSNLNIKAGLVISGGYKPILHHVDLGDIQDTKDAINKAITASETDWKHTPGRKGSNIQAGIEKARDMLNGETTADKENKFLILISDGGAFSWYDKEKDVTIAKFFQIHGRGIDKDTDFYYWCNPGDFGERYSDVGIKDGNPQGVTRSFSALMEETKEELVDQYSIENPGETAWDPVCPYEPQTYPQYDGYYKAKDIQTFLDTAEGKKFALSDTVKNLSSNYVTSREAALYHTTKSIAAASEEANVIFVSFAYYYISADQNHENTNLFKYTEEFKNYLEENNYVKLYRVNGKEQKYQYPEDYEGVSKNPEDVFNSINKDLTYLVAEGSEVKDTIGDSFDLVSIDSLTVDDKPLDCTQSDNTYTFYTVGDAKKTARFVVTYDAETKMLTWQINEPITKEKTVQLKYTLKLTEAKAGGVNDLDGDGKEDATGRIYKDAEAIYTNESAYLYPVDSMKRDGQPQAFPKPSVAVDASDYLLPILTRDKTAPKLNTRDHFAYVQGYPDGTVRPNGSVTRAETAAILFRLMDASSRSLYYSTAAGFRDVDSTKWYNTYVATLNNAGVITDSRDGYFRPDAAITRAELAAMLAQFTEQKSAAIYFSDVSAGYWAANAIARTAELGWINGYPDGTFGPDKTVTRAELMAMINRATGRAPKSTDALLTGMKTWKDNANTGVWYYLDVQEATNSHSYTVNPTEYWTGLEADPNWAQYE